VVIGNCLLGNPNKFKLCSLHKMAKVEDLGKVKELLQELKLGLSLSPLPPLPPRDNSVPHAPKRPITLTQKEFKVNLILDLD
jgi:hypothetical protein